MRKPILQGKTSRSPVIVNGRFREKYHLHLHAIFFSGLLFESPSCLLHANFLLGLIIYLEDGDDIFHRNVN
jgi:hypothetical protein